MSVENFVIKNYLECMKFSIENQTYFEINYEQTKELYNAIHKLLKENENQQKEIEEKTTILLAGSKKVKQLEKEIEELKEKNAQLINYLNDSYYVSADKIKEKLKELEQQKEKLKYDGNRSFADYEQFCKNLKFFKEQIEEILEEQ